jgi:hypothetical protein
MKWLHAITMHEDVLAHDAQEVCIEYGQLRQLIAVARAADKYVRASRRFTRTCATDDGEAAAKAWTKLRATLKGER